MKKYLILFFFYFAFFTVFGQKPTKLSKRLWGIAFSYNVPIKKRFEICTAVNKMFRNHNSQQYLDAAGLGIHIYSLLNNVDLYDRSFDPKYRSKYSKYKYYAYILQCLSTDLNFVGAYGGALYFGLEAEQCWKKIIESKKKINKGVDYMYAESLNNLAIFYYNSRDINEANKWIDKCIKQTQNKRGYENIYYEALNVRACILGYIGLHAQALKLEETIINNAPNILPLWKVNYINCLFNCNQKDNAIKEMEEFMRVQKSQGLGKSTQYASYLNKLALYKSESDINESIFLIQEALNILKWRGDSLSVDYAQYLSNLAVFYNNSGRKKDALITEERAYSIWQVLSNENLPQRLSSLFNLSFYQFENHQYENAARNAIIGTKIHDDNILYSMMQPKEVRHKFWEKCKMWYTHTIPRYVYYIQSDSLNMTAFNAALLSKGILLNTEQNLKELAENSGPYSKQLYEEWQESLARLNSPHPITDEEALKRTVQETEEKFIENCRTLENATKRLSVKWEDVQKNLSDKSVAIEFSSFSQDSVTTRYMALVLKKGMKYPQLVKLFEENQLKSIQNPYGSSDVASLVWEPLSKYINDVDTIYFAASGEIYKTAIEYVPHWSEDFRMSDKWKLFRLSSTRELALDKDCIEKKSAAIYGGITYDAGTNLLEEDKKMYGGVRDLSMAQFTTADSLGFRSGVSELPATKTEVMSIDKALKSQQIPTTLKMNTQATEGAFKSLSGKQTSMLHIATHGFYWTEKEANRQDHLDFLRHNEDSPRYEEDKAMTRSGLLFAGANNALRNEKLPEGVNDGILTASEISHLDLRGMDLVVLSACQTGLGEIGSDGVFGLQRGFKKAGANTLMMSLWKVDDNATQMLMTEFYRNLTSGRMSKYDALMHAQKYVREYEVKIPKDELSPKKGYDIIRRYENPIYWAAFILLDAI